MRGMSGARWKRGVASAIAVAVLVVALNVRDLSARLGCPIPRLPIPFGGSAMDNLLAVLVALGAAIALKPRGSGLSRQLGFAWPGATGPLLVLLASAPTWLVLSWQGGLAKDLSALTLFWLALAFPFAEEVVFRGFGYVFVRRALGQTRVAAVAVQAVAFGFVHWWGMGFGSGEALMVFAITGLGGVIMAVLDALDGETIWSGLVFHVSLNASWNVFSTSDNAVGSWLAVSVRLFSAALAIGLLWLRRRRRGLASGPNAIPVPID